jgi:hypothetical protein
MVSILCVRGNGGATSAQIRSILDAGRRNRDARRKSKQRSTTRVQTISGMFSAIPGVRARAAAG